MSILSETRKQELIAFTQQMIRAKSDSGEEKQVVEEIKKFCGAHRFTDVSVDRYGNCICHIKGNRPGAVLLFDGHMDTVPVPDPSKWKFDPYAADIVDGKMYGRGTSDMKGALSAMLAAAAFYGEDFGNDFAGDIFVAGVCHEECFEGVASKEVGKYVHPDYVVIGEASQLDLKTGQRGRAEIILETFGVPAHSASPREGVNAVSKMCKIVEELQKITPPCHDILGEGIMEPVDIKSSPYPGASVVPDYCRVTYDRRLLTGETRESVLKPVEELLEKMMARDPELKAKVSYAVGEETCWTGETIRSERFFPGWLFDRDENWVQDICRELKKIGQNPAISKWDFCTNGSYYAGEAGIRTIGIGPSKETLAHKIDEYIETDQLAKAAEAYYSIIKALLK